MKTYKIITPNNPPKLVYAKNKEEAKRIYRTLLRIPALPNGTEIVEWR